MAILGVDCLACVHLEILASHREADVACCFQVHFDPRFCIVPDYTVGERIDRDGAIQFAVDPFEQIEVESRSNPLCVIISRNQRIQMFDPVKTDEQETNAAWSERISTSRSNLVPWR